MENKDEMKRLRVSSFFEMGEGVIFYVTVFGEKMHLKGTF